MIPDQPMASATGHEIAHSGLVQMHALHVVDCERFQRTGRLTTGQLHAVALDLARLDRPHDLDATIERILSAADAIQLEREVRAADDP